MQGKDSKRPKSPAEELLEEAFDACMEEQMSFIPPESEIARMHTFSERFRKGMEQLLRTRGKSGHQKISRKEFVYGFNRVAAGVLIVLVVGTACAGGMLLLSKSGTKGMPAKAPAADNASMEAAPAETEAASGSAEYGEEALGAEALEEEGTLIDGGDRVDQADYCGRKIPLAKEQKLSGKWEQVKTLVNSPVIARDAESFKVTIGNMEEEAIRYASAVELEVLIDGAWYQVPRNAEGEGTKEERDSWVVLEPGMAQDEEIFLADYDWDYEAELYRVVNRLEIPAGEAGVMELFLGSEFRFENPDEDLENALKAMEE